MDNRHWPYDPHAPPGADEDGWVIAGEEQDAQIPPPRNGRPGGGGYEQPRAPRPGGYPPAGYRRREYGPAGYDRPEYEGTGYERPGYESTGYETPGYETSGYERPGYPAPGYEEPGYGRTGYGSAYDEYPPRSYPSERYPPPGAGRAARPYAGGYPPVGRATPPPPVGTEESATEPTASLATAASWTMSAFLVPILLYLGWAFTRGGVAEAGCVDAAGAPCPSPRVAAIEDLLGVLPAIGGALVLAMLIAVGMRQVAATWRPASIGLASAVVGAGIATVVAAALS